MIGRETFLARRIQYGVHRCHGGIALALAEQTLRERGSGILIRRTHSARREQTFVPLLGNRREAGHDERPVLAAVVAAVNLASRGGRED